METLVVARIRQIISAEKETANSFAIKIGVAPRSIYNLLSGGQPRIATIDKVIAAFPQYTKEWLMGNDGKVVDGRQDFYVKKLETELAEAKEEIKRLWGVINHFTNGKAANFLKAPIKAGANVISMQVGGSGARVGARA